MEGMARISSVNRAECSSHAIEMKGQTQKVIQGEICSSVITTGGLPETRENYHSVENLLESTAVCVCLHV